MAVSLIDVLVSGAPDTSPLRGVPAYTSGGLLITVVVIVLNLFMALLSFRGISTRAYRLKASNAAPSISTFAGTSSGHCCGLLKYGSRYQNQEL